MNTTNSEQELREYLTDWAAKLRIEVAYGQDAARMLAKVEQRLGVEHQSRTIAYERELHRPSVVAEPRGWHVPKRGDNVRIKSIPDNCQVPVQNRPAIGSIQEVYALSVCDKADVGPFNSDDAAKDPDYWAKRATAGVWFKPNDGYVLMLPLDCIEPATDTPQSAAKQLTAGGKARVVKPIPGVDAKVGDIVEIVSISRFALPRYAVCASNGQHYLAEPEMLEPV